MPERAGPDSPAGDRHAAEWGLASLILGGVLAVVAVLTIIFDVLYRANLHQIRPGREDVRVTVLFSGGLAGLFALLALANLIFGFVAVRSAAARRQPVGLPLAGLLLGVVVLLLWVAVAVGTVMEAIDLSRRFQL